MTARYCWIAGEEDSSSFDEILVKYKESCFYPNQFFQIIFGLIHNRAPDQNEKILINGKFGFYWADFPLFISNFQDPANTLDQAKNFE